MEKKFNAITVALIAILALRLIGWLIPPWLVPQVSILFIVAYFIALISVILKQKVGSIVACILAVVDITLALGKENTAFIIGVAVGDLTLLYLAIKEYNQITGNKHKTVIETVPPDTVDYAGFWKRFGAHVIDTVILSFVSLFVIYIPVLFYAPITRLSNGAGGVLLFTMGLIISWIYYAGMESSSHQGTFGKEIIGIRVTDLNRNRISFGRATIRYFAKIISALFLLIGFFMIGFTEKNQGLHDVIAGCLVIMKK